MNDCIQYWYKIWTKLTQNPKLYTNKNLCHLGSYLKILEHPHNSLKLIALAKAFREDEPVVVTTAEQKWGIGEHVTAFWEDGSCQGYLDKHLFTNMQQHLTDIES